MVKDMLIPNLLVFEKFKDLNNQSTKVNKKKYFHRKNNFLYSDCHFVTATLKHIKDLAGTFGNECVFYFIQDRKSSVRIGRPSARGHSPFIMHLDYQTSTISSTPIPSNVPHQLKPMYVLSATFVFNQKNSFLEFMHHVLLMIQVLLVFQVRHIYPFDLLNMIDFHMIVKMLILMQWLNPKNSKKLLGIMLELLNQ
jgi:hypothetical protein